MDENQKQQAVKFPLTAWETMDYARKALGAMLTHMGMDEDEWNKPSFDQARSAVRALEYQLASPDQVALWKHRYQGVRTPFAAFHAQAVAAGFDGVADILETFKDVKDYADQAVSGRLTPKGKRPERKR